MVVQYNVECVCVMAGLVHSTCSSILSVMTLDRCMDFQYKV